MPVGYIDIPSGLTSSTKTQLVKEVAESLHDAYPIPDTRLFLREWTAEQASIDGVLAAPFRPVCDFIVPPGLPADGKRILVSRVTSAVARACNLRGEVVPLPERQAREHTMGAVVLPRYPARAGRTRRPHGVREPDGARERRGEAITSARPRHRCAASRLRRGLQRSSSCKSAASQCRYGRPAGC